MTLLLLISQALILECIVIGWIVLIYGLLCIRGQRLVRKLVDLSGQEKQREYAVDIKQGTHGLASYVLRGNRLKLKKCCFLYKTDDLDHIGNLPR